VPATAARKASTLLSGAMNIVTESTLVDEILEPHRADLGELAFRGYRNHALPINDAYRRMALPMIGRYAIRHLSRPLPNLRW
jgi:hypothetical protein